MVRTVVARRLVGLGLVALSASSLAACGGNRGFESTADGTGSTLGNLIAFNKLHVGATPKRDENQHVDVDCPTIEILDGTAGARTYAGPDQTNDNVKYQFSMGDVVRECDKVGNDLSLKVGVAGRVLIGPKGSTGTFSAPVRIAIRDDNKRVVVTSKLYNVPVSVQPGQSDGDFSLVSDPIAVPFISAHADGDYTIVVGFDTQTPKSTAPSARVRRSRHHKAG